MVELDRAGEAPRLPTGETAALEEALSPRPAARPFDTARPWSPERLDPPGWSMSACSRSDAAKPVLALRRWPRLCGREEWPVPSRAEAGGDATSRAWEWDSARPRCCCCCCCCCRFLISSTRDAKMLSSVLAMSCCNCAPEDDATEAADEAEAGPAEEIDPLRGG